MAWVWPVFQSKQAFIALMDEEGWNVFLYPGPNEVEIPDDGDVVVEGPYRDHPPTWRAIVTLEDGQITSVT